MVGILIATHGGFAEGILNAAELIAGNKEKTKAIGLYHGDGIEEYEKKVIETIDELDDGDGVLVFVDLIGGTPSNTMLKLMKQKNIKVVSGLNLPMLICAMFSRDESSLTMLCRECKETGIEAVVSADDLVFEEENDEF